MPSWPRWSWWSLVTGSFGISTNIPWLGFWLSILSGDLSCVAPICNHATGRILKVWVSVVTSYCKKKVFWASGDEILQRYDRAKVFLVLVKIRKRASSARKLVEIASVDSASLQCQSRFGCSFLFTHRGHGSWPRRQVFCCLLNGMQIVNFVTCRWQVIQSAGELSGWKMVKICKWYIGTCTQATQVLLDTENINTRFPAWF